MKPRIKIISDGNYRCHGHGLYVLGKTPSSAFRNWSIEFFEAAINKNPEIYLPVPAKGKEDGIKYLFGIRLW